MLKFYCGLIQLQHSSLAPFNSSAISTQKFLKSIAPSLPFVWSDAKLDTRNGPVLLKTQNCVPAQCVLLKKCADPGPRLVSSSILLLLQWVFEIFYHLIPHLSLTFLCSSSALQNRKEIGGLPSFLIRLLRDTELMKKLHIFFYF